MALDYKYKTTPYKHQREVFERSADREYFALLMEMGTGKTKVVIDTAAHLYAERKIAGLLVVAPNGVHRNWNRKEIPAHLPDRIPRYCATWQGGKNTKAYQAELERLFDGADELKVLAMNVEAFSSKKGVAFAQRFLKAVPSLMAVDESSKIKSHKAGRTKAIVKMRALAPYRRILTGTPVTQSPLDIFPQFYFLDPEIFGLHSFFVFKSRYSVTVRKEATDGSGRRYFYEDIVRYRNLDEMREKVEANACRITKDECLDLPKKVYQEIPVELSKEQRRLYNKLREDLLLEADGEEIPVVMQLTRLLRLHQITGGFLALEDGTSVPVEGPNSKLAALMDYIETLPEDESVVIWARFRSEVEAIAAALNHKKAYGKGAAGLYYGDTSAEERAELIDKFQAKETRFFVGTQQAGSTGITLTAASNVIYYSNSFSLEDRLQSEDRCHRIGQEKAVVYVDLVGVGTIDRDVISALKKKKGLAEIVTGDGLRALLREKEDE